MSPEPGSLWTALESGVGDLELLLARAGQGVGVVTTVIAAYVGLFVSPDTGRTLFVIALAVLALYTSVHQLMTRGIGRRFLHYALPVFESTMPAAVLWVLVQTEGPAYAVGSWVPPQLFCAFLVASVLRLDPLIPVTMGAVGGLGYGLVWLSVRGEIDDSLLLYRDDMQIVRVGTLVLIGAACSLAVLGLKRAIGAANRDVRERDLFGKYQLLDEIASGGMGRVVDALYCPEGGFQRRVAIKLIHPHLARDTRFVERFRGEAELGARLVHPNIVGALDFGKVGDTYFLAMEHVDGPTLADVLMERRRALQPLPPRVVAWLGLQLADGLHHAHVGATDAEGTPLRVVHRDLSPSNVMLERSGRVRLTDFGVAKALLDGTDPDTRNLVGKAGYIAPEALRGEAVDERGDLWSLGVILWEALSNRRLFQRDHEGAAMLAVAERDPARRIASAAEVRDHLVALARDEGPVTPADIRAILEPEEELPELPLDHTTEG